MNFIQKALVNFAFKSGALNYLNNTYSSQLYGLGSGYSSIIEKDDNQFIEKGYATNTDLYSIIRLIIQSSNTIPFEVYKKTTDGNILVDEENDLVQLIRKPNTEQTEQEFREKALLYLLLTGDLFLYGVSPVGFAGLIGEMEVLPSNITEVTVNNQNQKTGYELTINGRTKKYSLEEVWHGTYINPTIYGIESHRGMSPLQAAYRTLSASNQIITSQDSFFKNKGVSGILSNGSDNISFQSEQAEMIQKATDRKLGGANKTNQIVATNANVKFTQLGMSPQDLEMIKSGDMTLRQLSRAYGIDSKLLNDPAASTYSNLTEAQKQMFTNAVIPNNERLLSYYNRFIVPAYSKRDNTEYFIKQDLSKIESLQGDKKMEAEKNKIVSEGIMSVLSNNISIEAKHKILEDVYGISEDDAKILTNGTGNEE